TFIIVLFYTLSMPYALMLAWFDFLVHFLMDRIKASPNLLGQYQAITKEEYGRLTDAIAQAKWNNNDRALAKINQDFQKRKKSNKYFWWSLGFDQMVHHLTDIVIIAMIIMYLT